MSSHKGTVMSLASDVKNGSLKDREKAVDDLAHLLNPRNSTSNLHDLGDKSYHEIFEAIFSFVLREKPSLYDKKKSQTTSNIAANRLSKCASAVRMAVTRGVSKLGRKTLMATIDHITQVLPGPDDDFVAPLLQDYVKSFAELFSRQAHVELIARKDGATWIQCVDFLLDVVDQVLPSSDSATESPARASPAPSRNNTRFAGRSVASTQTQKRSNHVDGGPLRDALEALHYLVTAANAPVISTYGEITNAALKILRFKHLSLGPVQTLCFSLINVLFSRTQADDLAHADTLVKEALPLMTYWWRPDKVSQDGLIRALRDEISKCIFLTHLQIERLAVDAQDPALIADLEDLTESLWSEYPRRSAAHRLQLGDLIFTTKTLPGDYFRLPLFGLRPYNIVAESHWAVVQTLAHIELTLIRARRGSSQSIADGSDEQPRKKRRRNTSTNHIHSKLKSKDALICETALQILPFLVAEAPLDPAETDDLLIELLVLCASKSPTIASWALVASASCLPRKAVREEQSDVWRQLWHLAAKLVTLPSTSRAASLVLHLLIELECLPYHTIADDVNNIVTTADINGPSVLCDTSVALMFHLFHTRNSRVPNASQATCCHIIRWIFMRWQPGDPSQALFQGLHIQLHDLSSLLIVCCGGQPLPDNDDKAVFGGSLSETWKDQQDLRPLMDYLLLLDKRSTSAALFRCNVCLSSSHALPSTDTSSFYTPRKLVLELLYPKLEELEKLQQSWTKKSSEGGTHISLERFQSLLSTCLTASILLPHISDLNTSQSSSVEALITDVVERSLSVASSSVEPTLFIDMTLRLVRPCIPRFATANLEHIQSQGPGLSHLLSNIYVSINRFYSELQANADPNSMDIDDDFDTQSSKASLTTTTNTLPRMDRQLSVSPASFYMETKKRLYYLSIADNDSSQVGLVPDSFIDDLLSLSDDELLLCQRLLIDLSAADLVISPDNALRLIERLGEIVGKLEYQCCEVALTTTIRVIEAFQHIWLGHGDQYGESVGDLYNHFVKTCLPSNIFSPKAQMSMAGFLFTLMKVDNSYASNLGLDSSRTSLLYVLKNGSMPVKYFISESIADIFELFVLMTHDDIFVDVLASLPTDPDDTSGIAFRLLVLAKLACRWSTLLRRCTYHIFEAPGKIPSSKAYAARCLNSVSDKLELESAKELFRLFSRQLLYTWLESDSIEDIPFQIFGFTTLADLLRSAQGEAVGLMIMRGQADACLQLAKHLGCTESELIRRNFATALAYSMIYGDAFGGKDKGRGEAFIERKIGNAKFLECVYVNFVDIASLFFDLIDQEDAIEKALSKLDSFQYAADAMVAIKKISHAPSKLPPNQQPMFRAKFLIHELSRLCMNTEYVLQNLWSSVFVVAVARKLFNTVHPALGSLHACSVLRKVRIVICLAGQTAYEPYCCGMLLNSTRAFIVDSECADDALGITQYLLDQGLQSLLSMPSFLAGYALSTLASLRVFLESSQSSTTQESQFKATMSKAQRFHEWFNSYLVRYDSESFASEDQRLAFKSITSSAARIRSSGNAEKGTSESKLLLDILKDGAAEDQLLNNTSRQLALKLLCGDFTVPNSTRDDCVDTDEDAAQYATAVWRSCGTPELSTNYLTWAGRVLGRGFLHSGEMPEGIRSETQMHNFRQGAPGLNGSEMGLVSLLQDMTSSPVSMTAGLGEAVLRTIVSDALSHDDQPLVTACQKTLTEPLYLASQWANYSAPPSETELLDPPIEGKQIWEEDIASQNWLLRVTLHLTQSISESIMLAALPRILVKAPAFAEKAFPYIVHLVLCFEIEQQQTTKALLSEAMKKWLAVERSSAAENQKLLINAILYLRTQEYPKESSIADRLHWLEVDYTLAATAASRCGMFRTALFFAELVSSESTRATRRSSAAADGDIHDVLLTIFENVDDPDAYYGLPEDADLSKVLARVEYESEGSKALAFRGAQYDSHIRLRDPKSEADADSLIKALGTLGLPGLSHSLIQTQQVMGKTDSSIESTFRTARKLEMWNLPVPAESDHNAVVIYKAYQSMHHAADISVVRKAVHDGLSRSMLNLERQTDNATGLRIKLGALAILSEIDDIMNLKDPEDLASLSERFELRVPWMRSGMYDDVSQIISCRATTMSMLSQHASLLKEARVPVAALRSSEVKSLLISSEIYRYHKATQESLNIATTLRDMAASCRQLGVRVDAAVSMETANSLWDHGEMSTSIRLLQSTLAEGSLAAQSIPVSRSDLLSKIAQKISVARLEKPQDIQKQYLEPALKELKGNSTGREAGLVFHQFAVFCDDQLQDPDGLEDLVRLQNLRQGKSDEVAELKTLISNTRDSQLKSRYSHVLAKEKQWLDLDEQELRRVEQTRGEFVRLSLENYLLSLIASDEHNNDALRFTALWLERSGEDTINKAVARHLGQVPTRKFATLMNQLTSRLQNHSTSFQKLLLELVYNICVDHPYHGMYQIWSGTKAKAQQTDDVAIQRVKATEKVAQWLASTKAVAEVWHCIDKTSKYYHGLAMDRNPSKYKSGAKIPLKESQAAHNLVNYLARYRIPPPTMHIEVSPDKDYSNVPLIAKLEPTMSIASGVSAPKIITVVASNGQKFKQLVKGGHDDLRQDAIMEQVFAAVSQLLKLHKATRQRNLGIRTYKVLPLTASSGLIEFVPSTIPLHEFLMPAHERYYPRDLKGSHCRKEIFNVQNRNVETRINIYRKVTDKFHPVMRYFFMENFMDPDEWFAKRLAYTRSTAAISMLGHILGLGDRHGHNILLDTKTGEVVHIDLGVAFEAGRILPVPELVPFRLTRDIVDGMGITKTEGVFRRCCEFTLDALREEQYSIMTILDVLRYDPLYTWSISPLRLAKLQKARQNDEETVEDTNQSETEAKKGKKTTASRVNEPSEAERALEVVRKKLSKTLSVTATVNDLINQATDERNLAVLYSGWAAYA